METVIICVLVTLVVIQCWNKVADFVEVWKAMEAQVQLHDQAILQLALKTKTVICTCGDPDCPATQPEMPREDGTYI